ncbi:MAG TPA: sigma-70 family RNA polymerase sigma factor [Candidatus Polarisedimenticolaceae bacterium]|nr:sigma-70 family RNA polymerase sigma factor [Candidatus Polarisedimenticolaceae bacterium]
MEPDTDIGGGAGRFPATERSAVLATRSADAVVRQRAFGALIAAYWKPIYKYIRIQWRAGNEEAKDLTQEFFARAMEKGYFAQYDPAKAAFRTYLRTCIDGFVANERKAERRLKRGGGSVLVPLDFTGVEGELAGHEPADGSDMDAYFRQEWVRSLFGLAVDELSRRCAAAGKSTQFAVFERYDLRDDEPAARPTYAQLGAQLGLPVTQVTNYLSWARREFRVIVLERLRELTGSDAEFRSEARLLLGVEPP